MKKYIPLLLSLLTLAGLAFAASEQVDRYGGQFPVDFNKGLYIGGKSDKNNGITRSAGLTGDYDFAALGIYSLNTGTIITPEITVQPTGIARPGDTCEMGWKGYYDGGTPLGVLMRCLVTSPDKVTIIAQNLITDGGAPDPKDAGYSIRTFSNR